jgi:hypothetical protein
MLIRRRESIPGSDPGRWIAGGVAAGARPPSPEEASPMVESLQDLQGLLTDPAAPIPYLGTLFNLVVAAILSALIGEAYVRWGDVLSNRRAFARNFVPIALTTTLIITVVKTSVALSLGLVGALSIIRFRTAIKDPQELAFIFLTISVGLGLGADQPVVTTLSVLFILAVIGLRRLRGRQGGGDGENLYLTVASGAENGPDLTDITAVLKRHCSEVGLKRFDAAEGGIEAAFDVALAGLEPLAACRRDLQGLDPAMRVVFVDQAGLAGLD